MKVIFLQDVPRVGKKQDIRDMNDGYAVNFLIPRKLAELATQKAVAELLKRKKNIAIEREVQTDLLVKNLEEVKDKVVTIYGKANEKGNLFKAIHLNEIVLEMKKQHHADISEEFIDLEKPVKEIGEFEIPIKVKTGGVAGKKSSFKLVVERI